MNSPTENDGDNVPVFGLDTEASYSLEIIAQLTGVSSQTILYYREHGLIAQVPDAPPNAPRFDDEALRKLRLMEHLRTTCELNEAGLKLMLHLLDEVERLRAELRGQR